MRKGQKNLIIRAKKSLFTEKQIDFLMNETYTIHQLTIAFYYFQGQNKRNKLSDEEMIKEICRVFSMEHNKISNQDFWRRVEYYLLPWGEDKLYGMSEKNEIANYHCSDISKVHFYCRLLYHISEQKIRECLMEKQTQYAKDDEKIKYMSPEYIFTYCCSYKETIEDINQNGWNAVFVQIMKNDLRIDRSIGGKINKLAKYCIDNSIVINLEDMEPVIEQRLLVDFNLDFILYGKKACLIRSDIWNFNIIFDDDMKQYKYNDDCKVLEKWKSPDNIRAFKDVVKKTKTNAYVLEPLYRVLVSQNNSFINIKALVFTEVKLSYQDDSQSVTEFGSKTLYAVDYFITPDVRFFEKRNGKTYPLSINSVLFMMKENPVFERLVQYIVKVLSYYNMFVLDVQKDYKEICNWMIPMTVNDILLYHSRKEFFLSKYKTAQKLNIKWNKLNMNTSYMILKCIPYVTGKSKNILLQTRTPIIIRNMKELRGRKLKDKIVNFLSGIIIHRIAENTPKDTYTVIETGMLPEEQGEDVRLAAEDYVNMCMQRKLKIRLDIKTERHLDKLHEAVNRVDYDKATGKVVIPKESRFNKLRKILPEEFEWIKTRRRLIMETKIQHHCVWSYAEDITNDKCAIYSYVDYEGKFSNDGSPKRYTIEFCMDKEGKYYVSQTQGRFDCVNSSNIQKYIESLLCKEKFYVSES